MSESHAAFVGNVPENYDRYLGPMIFEPYAVDIVERLRPMAPTRVLEIACGTGRVTRHLRDGLATSVDIVATDLNQAMLDVCARKFDASDRVTTVVADATKLPFGDAEFDAVVCQFGFMFFPDKPASFSECLRVLRPGGHLLFNVWDTAEHNEAAGLADQVVRARFPDDPPTFFRTPFGFNDRADIVLMLERAGFTAVSWTDVEKIAESPNALAAATGYIEGGPVGAEIAAREPSAVASIRDELAGALRSRLGDNPMRSRTRAIVFGASRP